MRAGRALQSALRGMDRAIESSMAVALRLLLSDDDKEALGIALYNESFNPENDRDGLYPWEEEWFARRLPAPPARLLIGAAGCGREATVLERRGYTIVALEPSKRAAVHCRATLGPSSVVCQASYQDLTSVVLDDVSLGIPLGRQDRFDAVLLGWGSFGHVLREEERLRLLRACDAICPDGPILLSVFVPPVAPVPGSSSGSPLAFFGWGGFLAEPSAEEIAAQCSALQRRLIAALDKSSPYFTLVPSVKANGLHANSNPRGLEH